MAKDILDSNPLDSEDMLADIGISAGDDEDPLALDTDEADDLDLGDHGDWGRAAGSLAYYQPGHSADTATGGAASPAPTPQIQNHGVRLATVADLFATVTVSLDTETASSLLADASTPISAASGCGCPYCGQAAAADAGDGTGDGVANNLLPGNFWVQGIAGTTRWSEPAPITLSYAMANGTLSDYNYYIANSSQLAGYAPGSANLQNLNTGGGNPGALRADLLNADALFESVAGITLNYFSGATDFQSASVDFRFMSFNNLTGLNGVATFPGTEPSPDGTFDAFILYANDTSSMNTNPELGAATNRMHVAIHEWGHSLGLGHPHDGGNGTTAWTVNGNTAAGDDELDNDRYTVMSYERGGLNANNQSLTYGYSTTPMALDVAALQYLYGSTANNTGNTVYTLTDPGTVALDIFGSDGTVSIGRAFYCIWDTGGTDTIQYSGTKAVVLNLNEATLTTTNSADIAAMIADLTGSALYNTILPAGTAGETRTDQTNSEYFAGGFFSRVISSTTGAPDLGGYSIANSLYATGGQTTIIENATGGANGDILIGNEQGNTLTGNGGNDLMLGSSGDDVIYGGSGGDELYGGSGNDTIDGGSTFDTIYGGTGNDTIRHTGGDFGADTYGGSGEDTLDLSGWTNASIAFDVNLDAGAYHFLPNGFGVNGDYILSSIEIVVGSDFDDTITGTFATQTLYGGSGNDTFRVADATGRFYDAVFGGVGTDTLDHRNSDYSGDLFDFQSGLLTGTHINGTSAALSSIEIYYDGTGGNEIISAGSSQTLYGGGGDDTMRATAGGETMYGGTGFDIVDLSIGNFIYTFSTETGLATEYPAELFLEFESFLFGSNNDTITTQSSTSFTETVAAGAGNDTVIDTSDTSSGDIDSYDGGIGTDTIVYASSVLSANNVINLALGRMLFAGADRDILVGFENATVQGSSAGIVGDGGANVLTATGDFANAIDGGGGTDTIYGGGGNDTLNGGAGADRMEGGSGNDVFSVDSYSDVVTDVSGIDRISTSLSAYSIFGNGAIEALWGTNAAGQTLTGNTLANDIRGAGGNDTINASSGNDTLYGGGGDDRLDGGAGADVMEGGSGNDVLSVDSYSDVVTDVSGIDRISTSLSAYSIFGNGAIEALWGTNAAGQTLTGNTLANDIRGAGGNDTINASSGNDMLYGGGGNDTLNGGTGDNTFYGGSGDDTFIVTGFGDVVSDSSGSDTIQTALGGYSIFTKTDIENLTGTGVGGQILTGNIGNNIIRGSLTGGDTINASSGNDTLFGNGGNDTLTGGAGFDQFYFTTAPGAGNVDTITDFSSLDDRMNVDDATFLGIGAGGFIGGRLTFGTNATTASQRVVYDIGTGNLWFDADGSGAGAKVLFAQLGSGTAIDGSDLFVF